MRVVPTTQQTISAEAMAERLGRIAEELHPTEVGKTPQGGAAAPIKPPEGPLKSAAIVGEERASYLMQLRDAIDLAMRRAEEILKEEAAQALEGAKWLREEPRPTEVVKPGELGATGPIEIVEPIKAREAPVEAPVEVPKPFEQELSVIQRTLKVNRGPHGPVEILFPDEAHANLYQAPGRERMKAKGIETDPGWGAIADIFGVDLPTAAKMAFEYRKVVNEATRTLEKDAKFEAPRVEMPKIEPKEAVPEVPIKKGKRYKTQRESVLERLAKVGKETIETAKGEGGEVGRVDLGMLARMSVGAAIGGTQGDTPEERVAFALGGLFLGAASKKIAQRLVTAFRQDPKIAPLLDTQNPKVPSAPRDATVATRALIEGTGERALVDKILTLEETDVLTAAELKGGKQIEMGLWERVRDLSERLRADETIPEGTLRETLALAQTLHDNLTHVSRRMGAISGRGLERVHAATARIKKLAKEWDPTTSEKDIAEMLLASKSIEEVGLATRLYFASGEALTETMYGSMLFGKALVKNAVGNAVMLPVSVLDRSLASLGFWNPNRPMLSEGPMGVAAMAEGILEQIRLLNKWTALGEQATQMGSTHIEIMPRGFEALADITSAVPALSKGFDFLHKAYGLAPEIMMRTDGMAKAVHSRMAIQWESMQQARAEGFTGEPYWNRVANLVRDYSQLPPEARVRIREHRDNMTFTRQLESGILAALQAGPTDPWLNLGYRLFVLPFVRTPVRLMDIGASYTPGLNLLSATLRRDWAAGGTTRAVAEARLATGTMVIGSFVWLAMQGLATGSMPDEHPERLVLEQTGRPPQSFWDPLMEKWRSYKGMEPLTQWISTGTDLAYLLGQLPEYDAERLLTAGSLAISNNINITQFMQAVSEFASVAKEGRTDSQYEKSLEFIRRRLTVFMPAAVKELTSAEGEQKKVLLTKEFDEDKSPSAAIFREFRALIDSYKMGFGTGPESTIKTRRNMFTGTPLLNDVWPFNPFTTKPEQPDPWAAEILRLNGAGLEPLDEWLGRPQPANIGISERPTAPGVRLGAPDLDRLEVLMTQIVKDAHGKLTDSLNALVKSDIYKRQSDVTKQEMIQARWAQFRQRAEARLEMESEVLKTEHRRKRIKSVIEKLPPKGTTRQRLERQLSPGAAP